MEPHSCALGESYLLSTYVKTCSDFLLATIQDHEADGVALKVRHRFENQRHLAGFQLRFYESCVLSVCVVVHNPCSVSDVTFVVRRGAWGLEPHVVQLSRSSNWFFPQEPKASLGTRNWFDVPLSSSRPLMLPEAHRPTKA